MVWVERVHHETVVGFERVGSSKAKENLHSAKKLALIVIFYHSDGSRLICS